jgi:hypothetical protein
MSTCMSVRCSTRSVGDPGCIQRIKKDKTKRKLRYVVVRMLFKSRQNSLHRVMDYKSIGVGFKPQ